MKPISKMAAMRSSHLPEMGIELQLPNRLTRQLPQSRAPWTNQLGGVVLQAPGKPGQSSI